MAHKEIWNLIKNAIMELYQSNPKLACLVENKVDQPTLAQWIAKQSATNVHGDHPEIVVFSLIIDATCFFIDLSPTGKFRKSEIVIESQLRNKSFVRGPLASLLASTFEPIKTSEILIAFSGSQRVTMMNKWWTK